MKTTATHIVENKRDEFLQSFRSFTVAVRVLENVPKKRTFYLTTSGACRQSYNRLKIALI